MTDLISTPTTPANPTVGRPQPTALQRPSRVSTFTFSNYESGSSSGGQTSGSFVHLLPPGAQLPDVHKPRTDFPPLSLMNPPPPRRLTRAVHQKSLQPALRASQHPQPGPQPPPPPSSWAVPFRGFVKAVNWSKSDSAPKMHVEDNSSGRKSKPKLPIPPRAAPKPAPEPEPKPSKRKPLNNISKRINLYSEPQTSTSSSSSSAAPGPVFLVPHHVHTAQPDLRPPTPGWMRPVAINPLEYATARTVIGHSSDPPSRPFDTVVNPPTSPPLADVSLRKSVSEIGHGSLTFSPLSPEASCSSLGQFTPYPQGGTPADSQDVLPQNIVDLASDTHEDPKSLPPPPPVPPKGPLEGFKRVLSFGKSRERKSASDIPSLSDPPPLPPPRHTPSKSVDIERHATETGGLEKDGRANRLRQQSVLVKPRNHSPSSSHPKNPQKFTLNPEASRSSILSTSIPTQSPSPVTTNVNSNSNSNGSIPHPPPAMRPASGGKRLVKRKPSESRKTTLPATVEVDTPKSLESTNPMDNFVVVPPPPLPPRQPLSLQTSGLIPTADAPSLPLSAPPAQQPASKPPMPPPPHLQPSISNHVSQHHPLPTPLPTPPSGPIQTSASIARPMQSHSTAAHPMQHHSANAHLMSHHRTTAPPMAMLKAPPPSAMKELRPAMPHRPSIERRASRRRWTFHIAAEDADDSVLVEELERLRQLGNDNVQDTQWTLAKKALLSSREVILTERSYLLQLTRFMEEMSLENGTPPLLVKHIPILASASEAFYNRLQEDPSAWGVSAAFVTVEAVLEQVFVDYCQVVGQIMLQCQQQGSTSGSTTPSTSKANGKEGSRQSSLSRSKTSIANGASELGRKLTNKSSEKIGDEANHPASAHHDRETKSRVPRSSSVPGTNGARRKSSSVGGDRFSTASFTMTRTDSPTSITPTHRRTGSLANGKAKAITAADIAIAPPQRVTRYVLLYRDLLNGTPLTAPSRPLVQRALDSALRIAENCDRAQGDVSLLKKTKV